MRHIPMHLPMIGMFAHCFVDGEALLTMLQKYAQKISFLVIHGVGVNKLDHGRQASFDKRYRRAP